MYIFHIASREPGWKTHFLVCVLIGFGGALFADGDAVEIEVKLHTIRQSNRGVVERDVLTSCVVSSNSWFISGHFGVNSEYRYWRSGTNLIEHKTITRSMYLERAKYFVSTKILRQDSGSGFSFPDSGETYIKIHRSPLGEPVFYSLDGVIWLAFCSGDYLKKWGRQIPMLVGPSSMGYGYTDKTKTLVGDLGLPKHTQLFATNGVLVCDYRVLEQTNFLGRILPTRFELFKRGNSANGGVSGTSTLRVEGRVTSLRLGKVPKIPDEVLDMLKHQDR